MIFGVCGVKGVRQCLIPGHTVSLLEQINGKDNYHTASLNWHEHRRCLDSRFSVKIIYIMQFPSVFGTLSMKLICFTKRELGTY